MRPMTLTPARAFALGALFLVLVVASGYLLLSGPLRPDSDGPGLEARGPKPTVTPAPQPSEAAGEEGGGESEEELNEEAEEQAEGTEKRTEAFEEAKREGKTG